MLSTFIRMSFIAAAIVGGDTPSCLAVLEQFEPHSAYNINSRRSSLVKFCHTIRNISMIRSSRSSNMSLRYS